MLSKEYQSALETGTAFMAKIEDLVREIAIQNSIPYYRIESQMDHNPYPDAEDVYTPVIRIITYFEDTVSKVTDILQNEFDLIKDEPIDKKKNGLDSFSYKHLEYTGSLKANRRGLTEYKRYGNKKFEIQLCSMLQDAWSGVEKELGYDAASFPDESKRGFYRVGALLEMADIEFQKLRSEKSKLQEPAIHETAGHIGANETIAHASGAEPPFAEAAAPMAQPETVASSAQEHAQAVSTVEVTPAQEEKIHPLAAAAVSAVVPKRTVTDEIAGAAASGIELQPGVLSTEKPAQDVNVDKFGSLSLTDTPIEKNDPVTDAQITDNAETTQPAQQQTPDVQNEIKRTMINTAVAPAQPANMPGEIAAATDVPEVSQPNNTAASATETINEQVHSATDSVASFFEEQPKINNRVVVLDENAPMTDASLREYVVSSKLLKEVDLHIAERAGAKINSEIDIEGDVERLRFLKVFTLKQLNDRIFDNKDDIIAFAEKWIGKDNGGSFDSGISLFYLEYLLVGKKNDPAFAIEYVVKFISDNDYSARYIIPTYNSIKSSADVSDNFSHLTLKA